MCTLIRATSLILSAAFLIGCPGGMLTVHVESNSPETTIRMEDDWFSWEAPTTLRYFYVAGTGSKHIVAEQHGQRSRLNFHFSGGGVKGGWAYYIEDLLPMEGVAVWVKKNSNSLRVAFPTSDRVLLAHKGNEFSFFWRAATAVYVDGVVCNASPVGNEPVSRFERVAEYDASSVVEHAPGPFQLDGDGWSVDGDVPGGGAIVVSYTNHDARLEESSDCPPAGGILLKSPASDVFQHYEYKLDPPSSSNAIAETGGAPRANDGTAYIGRPGAHTMSVSLTDKLGRPYQLEVTRSDGVSIVIELAYDLSLVGESELMARKP